MKNIIGKLSIFLLLTALFSSCIEDLGNYDYKELNEVTIEGINDDDHPYQTYVGAEFKITPQLTFSKGEQPDKYEYLWGLIDWTSGARQLKDTLSTERDLNITIGGVGSKINKDGRYYIIFVVINKETGIRTFFVSSVQVNDRTLTGYVLLCETGADSFDLDLISLFQDTLTQYHRVLDMYNSDLPRKGVKALDVVCYGDYISPSLTAGGKRYALWVLTDKWTNRVRVENFEYKPDFNISSLALPSSFFTSDNLVAEKLATSSPHNNTLGRNYIYFQGNWFFYNYSPSTWLYYLPINAASPTSTPYQSPPYIFISNVYGAVVFNSTEHRFEYHQASSSNLNGASTGVFCTKRMAAGGDIFDWENPYYDLVYMGNRLTASGFAVVKNSNTGKYEFLQFTLNALSGVPTKSGRAEFAAGFNAENMKFFAYHPTLPYLYCATEDNLYKINVNTMVIEELKNIIPSGHKISVLKSTAIRFSNTNRILIASYDPSGQMGENGMLSLYNVEDGTGNLVLAKHPDTPTSAGYQIEMRWTGFGKVIGADYKQPS